MSLVDIPLAIKVNISISRVLKLALVKLFFLYLFYNSWQDKKNANFKNTMQLNLFSALGMNIFFYGISFFRDNI
ncbi:MAG: hypothetical protein EAZ20_16240 [Bacteroidetes bacterium]|nr:MAG: hypothetical protein EAZ20_16240 [Bacteroidota bacterium]